MPVPISFWVQVCFKIEASDFDNELLLLTGCVAQPWENATFFYPSTNIFYHKVIYWCGCLTIKFGYTMSFFLLSSFILGLPRGQLKKKF